MKVLVYSAAFLPDDEFINFALSRGYSDINDPAFCSDSETIKFVEERLTGRCNIYLGRPDNNFRIGYAGFAQILEVDPNRTWQLRPNYSVCIGYVDVEYIDINVDQNGRVSITKAKNK